MIGTASLLAMLFSLSISFLLPIALSIYFYRRHKIFPAAILVGALSFAVSQLFTRLPLLQWAAAQTWYAALNRHTVLLAITLSFSAGLFEETGRFLGFRFLLKRKLEWKNGIAFGIGHGGLEAIVLVGITYINNLIFSLAINSGKIDSLAAVLPPEILAQITAGLTGTPPILFAVAGLERVMAIGIQIALSLVVLYGVKNKRYIFWLYAVLLHGLVNMPALLFLQGHSYLLVEGIIFIIFAAALVFIAKSKDWLFKAEFPSP